MNIIVTGTGKGIGLETVKMLSKRNNHNIIAISRNNNRLREWIIDSGAKGIIPLDYNLESTKDFPELVQRIKSYFKLIDILINNAGFLKVQDFEDVRDEDFVSQFNINTKVPFFLIQSLLPFFSTRAHIINIGSMGGYQGSKKFKGLSAYSIAKGALATLTECLAEELKPRGICVNCLALGATQTEMLAQAFPGLKAPLTADEMGNYISWFAVNGNMYFNGKVLPVSLSTP